MIRPFALLKMTVFSTCSKMTLRLFLLAFLLPLATRAQSTLSQVWVPDLGNGTYKNPVLYADYSDPDVVRVGADYYLTSSSFNALPGLQILHSSDLVNWSIIGAAFTQQPPLARYNQRPARQRRLGTGHSLPRGAVLHLLPRPRPAAFLLRKAKNPAGPWATPVCIKEAKGWIDPCPLWDEDGQAYLVHGFRRLAGGLQECAGREPA